MLFFCNTLLLLFLIFQTSAICQEYSFEYLNLDKPECCIVDCIELEGEFHFLESSFYELRDSSKYNIHSEILKFKSLDSTPSEIIEIYSGGDSSFTAVGLESVNNEIVVSLHFNLNNGGSVVKTYIFNPDYTYKNNYVAVFSEYIVNQFIIPRDNRAHIISSIFDNTGDDYNILTYFSDENVFSEQSIDVNPSLRFLDTSCKLDSYRNKFIFFTFNGITILDSSFQWIEDKLTVVSGIAQHGDIIPKEDSYILCGLYDEIFSGPPQRQLVVGLMDTSFQAIKLDTFGKIGADDYPFIFKSLESLSEFIFVGGHSPSPSGHHSNTPNTFFLAKFNEKLDLIWYKEFGGQNNHVIFGIKATFDGGCFAYGKKRLSDGLAYPYILRVNANGELTNTNDVAEVHNTSMKLINNPGPSPLSVQIRLPNNHSAHLHLVDLQGRNVFTSKVQAGFQTFDTSGLPSGLYVVTLVGEHGKVLDQEKWVKSR